MSVNKRIGILTGGGDCPGLNAAIRGVARRLLPKGYTVIGLMDGWAGLLENRTIELDYKSVSGILHVGGTILRTSRTNALKDEATIQKTFDRFKELRLDGIVAIGGEGTLTVASKLFEKGMPLIGVPKTIDNDIGQTDFTFGFATAVEIATEAIDRLHTTAESHNRVMVIEVMGRHAGWIATYSGIAGGADVCIIPEKARPFEQIIQIIEERKKRGKSFSIVVVAEGAKVLIDGKEVGVSKERKDPFGRPLLGGIGQFVADEVERRTGIEARVTVLGHVQRGGTPTASDRVLATTYGVFAGDLVLAGKWGMMAALQGAAMNAVPLSRAVEKLKTVPTRYIEILEGLEG
jgi:phosphofructokinase-like protein